MCGIAGFCNLQGSTSIIEQMLNTMKRRGPDASGTAIFDRCTLLHSRLAIIDPELGQQPMTLQWENEQYTISYNGELYNTCEIRDELIKLGHSFKTHSDTEVLLHAYAQWAESCVKKLNGIFAFAIWESKRCRLFLARDRMGVKPLFYTLHSNGIIFSSEIKTILRYPTVKSEIDSQGIYELILLGPGRTPGSGVFRNIYELEPGCYGFYCDGKWMLHRYWTLTDREHTESFEETAQYVKFLVTDSIKRQMVSDVPIGTFLSGGLDSSLISSICAQEMKEKGKTLSTFSVDYDNNDRYFTPGKFQPSSDDHYIQIMQEYLDSDHNRTMLTPQDLSYALEESTRARDLPGMADVDFSLLVFCKHIRKNVKVALSGECADEIFGGYPWFRDPEIRAIDGFPWSQNITQRIQLLNRRYRNDKECREYVHSRYTDTINRCDILPGTSPQERRMKQMTVLNIRWFMQTLLDRKDRMSMYSGLEVRVPFCDHRIAEYMYGVPWEYKNYEGREKGLLRHAMSEYLPDAIINRKKSPYPKTYDPHYMELMRKRLNVVLNTDDAMIFEIIDKKALKAICNEDFTCPWYGQLMGAAQTIAYILQLNYWLGTYRIDIV